VLDLWSLLLRTVVTYFLVFAVMRLMGKREIGKLSVFDLVISIVIAEIAVFLIDDPNRSYWHAIIPMVTLMVIQIVIAMITMRFRGLRLFFDGKPTIIIAKGKLNREAMRKQRYNLDDLMLQLRENKIASVGDVEFAILETSGKLTVLPKESKPPRPVEATKLQAQQDSHHQTHGEERVDFPPRFRFEILPIPLIMDGRVQDENLEKLGKTRFWLKNELQAKSVTDFKDVFLCTIDHKGKVYVDSIPRKPKT
jgi:uncharacterized membrane protein YcaP (DUF421 family)